MNPLSVEKQQSILQGYDFGLSVRKVADIFGCSPITVRTYLRKKRTRFRTISEGMIKYHEFRRGELRKTCDHIPGDCVNCRDIFSERCNL